MNAARRKELDRARRLLGYVQAIVAQSLEGERADYAALSDRDSRGIEGDQMQHVILGLEDCDFTDTLHYIDSARETPDFGRVEWYEPSFAEGRDDYEGTISRAEE